MKNKLWRKWKIYTPRTKMNFGKFLKSIKERSQKEELPRIDTLNDHFQTLYFKDFKETVNDKNDTPSEPIEKKEK